MDMKRSSLAVAAVVVLAACGSTTQRAQAESKMPPTTSAIASGASSSPSSSPAGLALQRWHEQAASSYSFRFKRKCLCQPLTGVVTVTDGHVTAWTAAPEQPLGSTEQAPMDQVPTIEGLLEMAVRAETEATGSMEIVFSPETGVPTDALIDWSTNTIDDEITWHVSDVRPFSEAPTVSSDRTMFCDLAVRATEGRAEFGSPGDTDALVTYNDLSTMRRVQLRSILDDAEIRTKGGNGWDNSLLVSFVNEVCGLHLTPVTMTP
jgi:hypothetical protein